ncbi:MAG TPA: tRNA (adenosine(37)-N6)-threonylcarbamoyltransferase complex dimerization subunit type 1 TsaB [Gemmatimonadales bacterium]|nr:tRNA (adenosine(37)-N6)-threonylcarbamoyltransferase complex dimerization subunit type 1 TsaB [Gemmatimonadales bacterium]
MWLAIETATDRASIALGTGVADAVERSIVGARRHAAELLPAVEAALADAEVSLSAISGLVVSDGPGSFTGLRVGASVAKALAHARRLPLWTAPSLLVRAAGLAHPGDTVLAVSNALRGDVYAAAYRFDAEAIRELLPPSVYRLEDVMGRRLPLTRLVGDVPPPLAQSLEAGLGRALVTSPEGAPRARTLLGLVNRPGGATPAEQVEGWEPVYGRPAEAQARWEMAHGRPLPDSIGRIG